MSREIPKILGHPILHRSSAGVADFNSPLRCDLVNTAWGHTQVTAEAASLFGLDQTHYENPDEDRAPRRVCHIAYGGICEAQELFAETMIVVERLHRNLGPKAAEVPLLVFKYRHGNGAESPVEHVEVPVLLGLSVSKPNWSRSSLDNFKSVPLTKSLVSLPSSFQCLFSLPPSFPTASPSFFKL